MIVLIDYLFLLTFDDKCRTFKHTIVSVCEQSNTNYSVRFWRLACLLSEIVLVFLYDVVECRYEVASVLGAITIRFETVSSRSTANDGEETSAPYIWAAPKKKP